MTQGTGSTMAIDDTANMAIETDFPILVGEDKRKFYNARNNAILVENVI